MCWLLFAMLKVYAMVLLDGWKEFDQKRSSVGVRLAKKLDRCPTERSSTVRGLPGLSTD